MNARALIFAALGLIISMGFTSVWVYKDMARINRQKRMQQSQTSSTTQNGTAANGQGATAPEYSQPTTGSTQGYDGTAPQVNSTEPTSDPAATGGSTDTSNDAGANSYGTTDGATTGSTDPNAGYGDGYSGTGSGTGTAAPAPAESGQMAGATG